MLVYTVLYVLFVKLKVEVSRGLLVEGLVECLDKERVSICTVKDGSGK